jgi:hypothetical protein
MGEAIVTTVVQKVVEKKERGAQGGTSPAGLTWGRKLGWLNRLLWGGVLLLAFEHWWHGEIVPWPPFLTAMANPADVGPMFYEMATIGTGMAVLVTVVWLVMVVIAERKAASAVRLGTDA